MNFHILAKKNFGPGVAYSEFTTVLARACVFERKGERGRANNSNRRPTLGAAPEEAATATSVTSHSYGQKRGRAGEATHCPSLSLPPSLTIH